MQAPAYGIDLGTTNSCIARYTPSGFEVVPIDERPTVPSVLAWSGQEWLVGQRAANHAMLDPLHAVRSIKRHMGDADYKVQLGGAELTPIEVSAKILAYLKVQAEAKTGDSITEVVITVPAWFNEPQRRATLSAGERAGLKVSRIINEPTSAALAFERAGEAHAYDAEERWLVYDLGGGTFDVSVLSVSGTMKEVLASCGNTYLGGDDFDHRICLYLVDWLRDRYSVDAAGDRVVMARLRHLAEQCKIRLSTEVEAPIQAFLHVEGRELELAMTLTRQQFEAMIHDYVESTIAKVRQALDEARVEIGQLNRVLLVGGSTRIPLVQQRVSAEVGVAPEAYVDVDLSVALGAAAQSALGQGLSCAQIVVDISPHALGIAVLGDEDVQRMQARARGALEAEDEEEDGKAWIADGQPLTFAPVIRKNARLPAKFVEEFYTVQNGQEGLDVRVYQGESRNNLENVFVGSFFVSFAPKPAGSPVHIGFEYDQSGLVRVSVAEQGSTKVLKSYTMDLKRSADSNTEARAGRAGWHPADDPDEEDGDDLDDAADRDESSVSNYLIEQIERRLAAGAPDAYPEIRSALVSYRQLLAAGDDAAIDSVEERLYAWIEVDRGAIAPDSSAG
ncbi:MAG: Hsp70 family protein [Gammaproteobacteria bacterium]